MMKFTQRGALVGALATAFLCAAQTQSLAQTNASAETTKATVQSDDPVVAKAKGIEVKRSKVDDALISYKASLAARGAESPDLPREVIEAKLVEKLVLTEILLSKATAEDKAQAKEKTDESLEKFKKSFPSEEMFNAQVKASGMTMDQFRASILERVTCNSVLDREVRSTIKVSDADLKKFYDERPSEFEQPELVRASHILLMTTDLASGAPLSDEKKKEKEKLAKELKARAEKGEDFAKLAKEYSEDPGSKDSGGDLGKFPRGAMLKEFEAAAFSLKTNQVSDVVETQYGYHIIKLLEHSPASTMDLATATPKLKEYLTDKQFVELLPAYLEKLKKEENMQILDEKLAKALKKTEEENPLTSTNAPAAK